MVTKSQTAIAFKYSHMYVLIDIHHQFIAKGVSTADANFFFFIT